MMKFGMRKPTKVGFTTLVLLLAIGACSKKSDDGGSSPARIAPMPPAEIARAEQACTSYVARVCACADTHPELTRQCELAKASPGALQINLELLQSDGLEIGEQKAVKVEARKIAAVCFEADGKLDAAMCPRKSP
jgi:hypothetical protein